MKKYTNNEKIVFTAVLGALGFLLNLIEIPWPLVAYLKIDISEVVVLIAMTISLPSAFTVAILKATLMVVLKGSELIGISAMVLGSFTLILSYYTFSKFLGKYLSYVATILTFTVILTGLNLFLLTPLYSSMSLSEAIVEFGGFSKYFMYIITMYVPFNLVKATIIFITFDVLLRYLINPKKEEDIKL